MFPTWKKYLFRILTHWIAVYRPIFWDLCFHMSHCCGMVSWEKPGKHESYLNWSTGSHRQYVNHTMQCEQMILSLTLTGLCNIKVHITSSMAAIRLGARPHRQADCRSSRAFATGSPGQTLCCKPRRTMSTGCLSCRPWRCMEREVKNIFSSHLRLSSQVLDPVEDPHLGLLHLLLRSHILLFAFMFIGPPICLHRPLLQTERHAQNSQS